MLKKILIPVTAAMLFLVSPVTLYAADNTSVGEVPAKFNLERDSILEHHKMDGVQLTSEDLKGHWLAAEVEDFNVADFDSNGDCHITIFQNGKNNDLCIHPDGSYESEEIEEEKIDQFQVLKSNDFIFYYSLVDDSYGGFLFMNGEQSDRAYVIEAESDLYLSEDKFILMENQKAYDYELIENTILCLDEDEIIGMEIIAYSPDLVVCRNIQTKTSGVGEMSDLIVFVRENALEAE